MNKKTLYLHVGFPKTGTSAIQDFLYVNSDQLKEIDYYYPKTGLLGRAGHALLAPALKRADKKTADDLLSEISGLKQKNIIISAEFFFGFTEKEIEFLKSLFENFAVYIVVYFRRQDHRVESGYIQVIKDTDMRFSRDIARYIWWLKKNPRRLNYYAFLRPWAKTFGKTNIIVRVYEKRQLPDGLLPDFLKNVGIHDISRFTIPEKDVNPTLPVAFVKLLKFTNRFSLPKNIHLILLRAMMSLTSLMLVFKKKGFSKPAFLSPEQRRKLLAQYEESNKRVAVEYLRREDGVLFYEPPPV